MLLLTANKPSVTSSTDLLLNSTEELEHGDVGRRFGHAQRHADALQLLEHGAA